MGARLGVLCVVLCAFVMKIGLCNPNTFFPVNPMGVNVIVFIGCTVRSNCDVVFPWLCKPGGWYLSYEPDGRECMFEWLWKPGG